MITSKAVFDEYDAICKEDISADDKVVKILKFVLKLLLGIRTNQMGGVRKDDNAKPEAKTYKGKAEDGSKVDAGKE